MNRHGQEEAMAKRVTKYGVPIPLDSMQLEGVLALLEQCGE
jgi:hypothetical protein